MKYNMMQAKLYITFMIILLAITCDSFAKMNTTYSWGGAVVYSMLDKMGSGVPVSKCHVLTNEHVIRGSPQITVYIDKKYYFSYVVSVDKENDMALIKLVGCPLQRFAKLASQPPAIGEILTSVYCNQGYSLATKAMRTEGEFVGFERIVTEENKIMDSMHIDDSMPRKCASGGGVSNRYGLVSIIFGISPLREKSMTYGVSYFALRAFLARNKL
ncbi:MAG: trypsin-like peptidase domain-containing protein [Thiotrichaceae bacterium]|nr:trypsin-like peptidase domain-containing protein [Thiotrichaceae bacterium]